MSMYIRAGDLQVDDVIQIAGEDLKVIDRARYRKQSRQWVNLVLQGPLADATTDRAFPIDVIVQWRGTALF